MSGPTFQCTVLLQKCVMQCEGTLAQFPFSRCHLVLCLFSRESRGCHAFQRWMHSLVACLVLVVVLLYSDYATLPSTWITECSCVIFMYLKQSICVRGNFFSFSLSLCLISGFVFTWFLTPNRNASFHCCFIIQACSEINLFKYFPSCVLIAQVWWLF